MGKEKDKKPLFGSIFQKFFKPSAKAEAKKKKEYHLTVQRSIPYLEMGRDGICRVEEHLYSKTVRFYDINYQLAQNEDKNTIFESWCDFLNYFDSSIRFQLSFINHKSDMSEYSGQQAEADAGQPHQPDLQSGIGYCTAVSGRDHGSERAHSRSES